ncbi:MAG TPA: hypothetical protein VLF67_04765 [Candidatus Saccharimonas sp.]|nr:hypothetical protein [Candidatus Saccharimonas sp.]
MAASGGAALAFSGVALAADASGETATTTSDVVSQVTQTVDVVAGGQFGNMQTTTNANTNDVSNTRHDDQGASLVSADTTAAATPQHGDGTVQKDKSVAAVANTGVDGQSPATGTTTVAAIEPAAVSVSVQVPDQSDQAATAQAVAPVSTRKDLMLAQNREQPAYHTVVMSLQPVITNIAAGVVDLAETMPSNTAHNTSVPAPKSTGSLVNLTAQLASTTMPLLIGGLLPVMPGLLELSALLALVVCLLSLVATSYGLWLRRSGYTTAARSDMASFHLATLRAWNHALANWPAHGSSVWGVREENQAC